MTVPYISEQKQQKYYKIFSLPWFCDTPMKCIPFREIMGLRSYSHSSLCILSWPSYELGCSIFEVLYKVKQSIPTHFFLLFPPKATSERNNTRIWDYFCCMNSLEFRLLDLFQVKQTVHLASVNWSFPIYRSNPKSSRKDHRFPVSSTYQGDLEGNFHCGLKCWPFKNFVVSLAYLENPFHDQKSGRSSSGVVKVSHTHTIS